MGHPELRMITDTIRLLSLALGSAQLYSSDHPHVLQVVPRIVAGLRRLVGADAEETLVFAGDILLFQGKPLQGDLHTERVARCCARLKIGFVRFAADVDEEGVRQLLRVLVGGAPKASLEMQHAIHIGAVTVDESGQEGDARTIPAVEALTRDELGRLDDFYATVGEQGAVEVRDLVPVVGGFIAAFRREANPFLALAPLRMIDEYSFTHSVNVAILNIAQGMMLGVTGQSLHDLGVAGMLHDVGKIFVSREITAKPDSLSAAEWEVMRTHASRGAQYLLGQSGVPYMAVICAYEHHMRYDLQGYPAPPPGWRLHPASQMTMISDTFDALRTNRVYKDAWDFSRAAGHMLNLAGSQLHRELTLQFLKILGQYGDR